MAQDTIAERFGWGLKLLLDKSNEGKPEEECLDTWETEDRIIWARDVLPSSIRNLRVFAYGYAGTPKSACNRATVHSIAVDFLSLLTDERDLPRFKYRPLILAGHNLGGNIIKEALVIEKGRSGGEHRDIYYSTCGVFFFGTPHGGLNASVFKKVVMKVAMANRHPLAGLLDKTSGTLGWTTETVIMVDTADHIRMCKLGGTKDPPDNTGNLLAQETKKIITGSAKATSESGRETAFADKKRLTLEWLGVVKMQPGKRPIEPAKGTCESVAQKCFDKWHVGPQDGHGNLRTLWVKGPRGCGKAHLAKYMAENWEEDMVKKWEQTRDPGSPKPRPTAIVAHCSVNDIITQYRIATSVAICWLREVLDAYPILIRHLTGIYDREAADNRGLHVCDWDEDRIVDLWQEVIAAVSKEVDFLVFIADGMDKCSDPSALPTLLDWVAQAAAKAASSGGRAEFQVLVFSNDSEDLRHLNQFPSYQLTTDSFEPDVECALRDRVNAILRRHSGEGQSHGEQGQQRDGEAGRMGDSELGKLLWKTISSCGEKTHLWATVLVGEIETADLSDKASLVAFLESFNSSSDGGMLDALYGTILQRISSTGGLATRSLNVLFWMMHHIGTMNMEELRAGCSMLEATGFGRDGPRDGRPKKRIQEEDVRRIDYRTLVRAVRNCGDLVKVWPGRLCLIHDSFREYLTSSTDTSIHRDYRCSQKKADKVISRLCVDYLLLRRFGNPGPRVTEQGRDQWEDKVHDRVKGNKFMRYASLRWIEHLERSGKGSPFRKLLDPEKGYMRNWTEVLWYWTKADEGVGYPEESFPWDLFPLKMKPSEEAPLLNQPPPKEESWWRQKRVWFALCALVLITIGGAVGGVVGSQPIQRDGGQAETGTNPLLINPPPSHSDTPAPPSIHVVPTGARNPLSPPPTANTTGASTNSSTTLTPPKPNPPRPTPGTATAPPLPRAALSILFTTLPNHGSSALAKRHISVCDAGIPSASSCGRYADQRIVLGQVPEVLHQVV
ncbi:hypothetical protein F5144DRAFT_590647 [Chaetomium tenue]|uniref:Uncharacterized protein n=1 Tax=Chaetomium tenue TaxID=1854479 RepID=A0ACB7PIB3_9PEZI|nr:hypothetical protein F5144DRAFT_590647 [Chaetomium globosum]